MWAFIAPLIAFLVIGSFHPEFGGVDPGADSSSAEVRMDDRSSDGSGSTKTYIALVGAQVVVTFGLLIYFRRTYLDQFPFELSFLAIPVGLVGVVLWIAICNLGLERAALEPFGLSGFIPARAGFDPFRHIADQSSQYIFLLLRFSLLALLVPIAEELFVRGFLIRYIETPDWWTVSLANLSLRSVAMASVYGVITHPGEALAALVWFSLVSWLMLRKGNLWDCVAAHCVTNFALGIYIVTFGAWHLW